MYDEDMEDLEAMSEYMTEEYIGSVDFGHGTSDDDTYELNEMGKIATEEYLDVVDGAGVNGISAEDAEDFIQALT